MPGQEMARTSFTRLPRQALAVVVLALALAALGSAPAGAASSRSFHPVAVHGSTLLFKVRGITPSRIDRALLKVGTRSYRLSPTVVRRAVRLRALLRTRPTLASAARHTRRARSRLVVYLKPTPRKTAKRKTTGPAAKSGADGTSTAVAARPAPAAAPAPTGNRGTRVLSTATCDASFGSFSGPSALPSACWRPYSDASPFNQPLPSNPRVVANSDAVVSTITGWGRPSKLPAGNVDDGDWDHPMYYSSPTDPVFTVHCTETWGTCEVEGMKVRIPDAARPAASDDAHMGVVDQAGQWEYDFWTVKSKPAGGGTLNIGWGGRTRIGTPDADGLDTNATAAHFGLLAGVVRVPEMQAGQINHALFMVVHCTSGQIAYPAQGKGSVCGGNAPAMGARFQLAMSDDQIAALNVPEWRKTIFRAMAHYGLFVGDTGGPSWHIQFESSATYTSFGAPDPWVDYFDAQPDVQRDGRYRYLDMSGGVDWQRYLRVVDPCVTQRTC